MRVLLIAGGWSPEREISLMGAKPIAEALQQLGHQVTFFTLSEDLNALVDAAKGHDVAFINLHGAPGEDGLVQAILDRIGLPYQGSDAAGSFLALNKAAAKALFASVGLKTPRGILLSHMPVPSWKCPIGFPVFAKSNTGGSSLHLARAENDEELRDALQEIFDSGSEAIIEEFIAGKEVTCGILDGKALPPVLIVPKRAFFDFHDKYSGEAGAAEICPAPLPEDVIKRIQAKAEIAHKVLGLEGYSRADFILTETGEAYILEVNTLPGMTAFSLVPKEAAAAGISYLDLVDRLLKLALKRKKA